MWKTRVRRWTDQFYCLGNAGYEECAAQAFNSAPGLSEEQQARSWLGAALRESSRMGETELSSQAVTVWYQIAAPHYCAGIVVDGSGIVVNAAPILRWVTGKKW